MSGGGVGGAVGEVRSAAACSATEPAVVHLGRTRSRSARVESTMDTQSARQRQWAMGAAVAAVCNKARGVSYERQNKQPALMTGNLHIENQAESA